MTWVSKAEYDWQTWLGERVFLQAKAMRRDRAILRFVEEGLTPWIRSKGYEWASSEREIAQRIANGIYQNRGRSTLESVWNVEIMNDCKDDADLTYFESQFERVEWDRFWKAWGDWYDVDPNLNSRGWDRRFDLESFIWGQLDLDHSPATQVVNELINDPSMAYEDGYPSRDMDPYLQDHGLDH